jgi:hypothetical protein
MDTPKTLSLQQPASPQYQRGVSPKLDLKLPENNSETIFFIKTNQDSTLYQQTIWAENPCVQ